jgi:hypothetical protein
MRRFSLVCSLALALGPAAHGQTVIVDETFDYTTEAELHAVWAGNPGGTATAQQVEENFVLTTEPAGISADFNGDGTVDAADYPVWRKTINTPAGYDAFFEQFGGPPAGGGPGNTYVNRVTPNVAGNLKYVPALDPNFIDGSIFPSQGLEPIVLRGDIFTPSSAIQRNTIGLRATTATENIFEMGMYNSNDAPGSGTQAGTTGAASPGTDAQNPAFAALGVRATLFFNQVGANQTDPNWSFFAFDPLWDTNSNGLVTAFEAFSALGITGTGGWHTLEATFTPLEPGGTVASGDVNITVTVDLLRDGMNNAQNVAGVDGTITITNLRVGQNGFGNLRIGGPSQVSSSGAAGFDNIYLSGPLTPPPGGGGAVPEPSSAGLAIVAAVGAMLTGRRNRT